MGNELWFALLYWVGWLRAAQQHLDDREIRRTARRSAARPVAGIYHHVDGFVVAVATKF